MVLLSVISIFLAAFISIAVVFRKPQSLFSYAFSLALLSTAFALFGDSMIVMSPDLLMKWKRVVFVSEAVMACSWLLFAVSFSRNCNWDSISKFHRFLTYLLPFLIVYAIVLPVDEFFYSPEFANEQMLFLGNAGYGFNLILLLYLILAIANLEATLKSSSGIRRWNIKYMLIGVGGILAMNIFYFSHSLLYRSLNMSFIPVRTGVFLFSSLVIGFSLLRHRAIDVDIVISRRIVYRSIALFVIGFYLLGIALLGEGFRYFDVGMGKNITALLGFIGAVMVLAVVLSEKFRRKIMVFISKNFYSQKYDYREQWLQFTRLISLRHSFDELLSSIAEGFMDATGTSGVGIWLKNENGEYDCAKKLYLPDVTVEPDKSLIEFLADKEWIFNVQEQNCRDIAERNSDFIRTTKTSLVVPLLHGDELIGFIVLMEGLAGDDYNYEDYDLMKTLARQTTVAILNSKLIEELTEAKEMEAVGRVSSFIIHDLKNAASMLSLTAENAKQYMDNPEFQKDAIRTVINTSEKIKSIIAKLKNLPEKPELHRIESDLGMCVQSVLSEMQINGRTAVSYNHGEPVRAAFDEEEIKKVVFNLILNAIDATGGKGEITITTGREEDMGYVRVSDNGCGMSQEFIQKNLFKPFHTTKKKGLGIGLYQCRTIAEAHSGKLNVRSQEGRGSDFILYLPL